MSQATVMSPAITTLSQQRRCAIDDKSVASSRRAAQSLQDGRYSVAKANTIANKDAAQYHYRTGALERNKSDNMNMQEISV
ncbi:hypothetical protein HII31_00704 [Pseudocercospora fuligena]|uniref:Uncharacterized protein n=1 Tax=Pseudocercospora fuligena TaxID=685502 RepID=A0A8H6VTA2_9PEZI|nr:hypothetical protein HII31_00704 [Pseudocercospora fuligena]